MARPQSACARQHGYFLCLRSSAWRIPQRSESRRVWQIPLLAVQGSQAREAADRARLRKRDLLPGVEKRIRISYCTEEKTTDVRALPTRHSGGRRKGATPDSSLAGRRRVDLKIHQELLRDWRKRPLHAGETCMSDGSIDSNRWLESDRRVLSS